MLMQVVFSVSDWLTLIFLPSTSLISFLTPNQQGTPDNSGGSCIRQLEEENLEVILHNN